MCRIRILQNILSIWTVLWDNEKKSAHKNIFIIERRIQIYEKKNMVCMSACDEHDICCMWFQSIYRGRAGRCCNCTEDTPEAEEDTTQEEENTDTITPEESQEQTEEVQDPTVTETPEDEEAQKNDTAQEAPQDVTPVNAQ